MIKKPGVITESKKEKVLDSMLHKVTPSEIGHGALFLSRGDGMEDFFRSIDGTFDVVTKWETLYQRRAGSQYVWVGYQFMRHFNPFDVIKISKLKNNTIRIEKYVKSY